MGFINNSRTLSSYLRTSGGANQANGDYSVTAERFYIAPPANQNYIIRSLAFKAEVAGDLSSAGYGDGAVLTNGISMLIEDSSNTEFVDFLDGKTIKSNADWGLVFDFDNAISRQSGNAILTGDAILPILFGDDVKLFGAAGHRLTFIFNDNLSATGSNDMLIHEILAKGTIETVGA